MYYDTEKLRAWALGLSSLLQGIEKKALPAMEKICMNLDEEMAGKTAQAVQAALTTLDAELHANCTAIEEVRIALLQFAARIEQADKESAQFIEGK